MTARKTGDVQNLLDAVKAIGGTLQIGADASDRDGRLSPDSIVALRASGLWQMRLCRELGGHELPITEQIEVLAALASQDTAAAWCTMIANSAVAVLGATMPDAAIERIFASGIPACSIVAAPSGVARPVDGGYMLDGTWRLAGSIRDAQWVHACALVERDPSRVLPLAIPACDVEVLDTWNVVGLGATGSNDFRLADYFLPAQLAGTENGPYRQVRGQRRYDRVDVAYLGSYEHLAFAMGVARRALGELRQVFTQPPAGHHVGDRELVQEQFGRAAVRLQTIEALAESVYRRIDAAMLGDVEAWSGHDRHLPRVLAAQASELALECVQLAFRRSGMASLRRPNIHEKLLRDMSVAAIHTVVDDYAFATYTQSIIENGLWF